MPHHDASTFTINIALNRVGIDYEVSACKKVSLEVSQTSLGSSPLSCTQNTSQLIPTSISGTLIPKDCNQ